MASVAAAAGAAGEARLDRFLQGHNIDETSILIGAKSPEDSPFQSASAAFDSPGRLPRGRRTIGDQSGNPVPTRAEARRLPRRRLTHLARELFVRAGDLERQARASGAIATWLN